MGLSDLTLPGSVIADLYKQSLVQADAPIPAPVVAAENKTGENGNNYKYLGNNQQHITLVVSFENEAWCRIIISSFLPKCWRPVN